MIKKCLGYIEEKRRVIIDIIVVNILMTTIFYLSDIALSNVLYGLVLYAFVGAVFLVTGFVRYYKKIDQLKCGENVETCSVVENIYQDRIKELEEKLAKSESKYDEININMSDYYSMWVHQIKTPIAAMNLLLQTEDVPDKKELENELFKIEQYVEMVLSYIRMQGNSNDYVFKKYVVGDIVRQAVRKYAKLFVRKKIKVELADNLNQMIITDEKWMLFVVEQILSNSLKYTNFGVVKLYMEQNNLCIEDTGIGIAKEDIPRIFEKGYTGYNGRREIKSTGIGLYLCKCIIDELGHRISVKSEVGKGTVIMIDLSQNSIERELEIKPIVKIKES